MKIALVILHADVARGGAERYTVDLARALVDRGHAVSVLASSFQESGIARERVLMGATGATRTRRYLSFLDSVDLELDRGGYDIVHAMLPVRRCDVYHPHAGVAAEAPSNLFTPRRRKFAAVERALLLGESRPTVLCLSNLIGEVVRRFYPEVSEDRLVPLFNGTDLRRFDPSIGVGFRQEIRQRFGIVQGTVVGLMLAQDFERKGLRQAIEALAKLGGHPALRNTSETGLGLVPKIVLLVGGRPDPLRYRRLAESLGVSDHVIFAGSVENPVAFYQAADFFVLPTRFDPCSLVVLEALAMGVPVISTAMNGACEVMRDGVEGFVLGDANDLDGLAAAMGPMMDTGRRAAMAKACLELRPRLSQDWHLDRLVAVYDGVLARKAAKFH